MRLLKKILPLIFLFNLAYSQDWKISEDQYLIKYKDQEYHSKLANKGNAIVYYIYRINEKGEEEVIGDDANEVEDYKDLALASHFNFNKGKILLRTNQALEMFRSSNSTYKTGNLLNKAVEELSEIDATLLLNIGNKKFSIGKELSEKYLGEIKEFGKNFMQEVINDRDEIKSLDNLVKKLEEKIFNSTVIKAKENIKRLESAKNLLLVSHSLSTEEVKLAEKLVSEYTIKGYSIAAFQNAYMENVAEIRYQLTEVGSSMLKSSPKGKKVYDYIKKLGINGIEEIDSEALRKSFKKMQEVHERISLSMNLYKDNFDPSLEGSSANSLMKELSKKSEESLSNMKLITGKDAFSIYSEPKPIGSHSVNTIKDSNSVTFEMSAGIETFVCGWVDSDLDFKKIKKNVKINLEATAIYFNPVLFYSIGITDGREPHVNPEIKSSADYNITKYNPNLDRVNWDINLYNNGKLEIKRDGNSTQESPNFYSFYVGNLNKWVLRIVAYTRSFGESKAKIKFSNIKVKLY